LEPVSALAEGAKSSMFAETALDNRTGERIHGHPASPFDDRAVFGTAVHEET